jgi:L-lactate dehydrogenase
MIQKQSVGIVGAGSVGVATAYALFNQKMASEIILTDINEKLVKGEALDLMHGQLFIGNVSVKAGDYSDMKEASIIVISAGVGQSSSEESRLDLLKKNLQIFKEIINHIDRHNPNAIIIIATNPVDILTYAVQKMSSRPPAKIIGTGTLLDTARFRYLLGHYYGVNPQSVHAYILGEHGDSELPIWSKATIGGKPVSQGEIMGKSMDKDKREAIFKETKEAAYNIIDLKGHTDSAIGVAITHIVRSLFHDDQSVMPVSVDANGSYGIDNICLSLPAVIGLDGIQSYVLPDLNHDEIALLRHSASVLKDKINELDEF